MTINILLDQLRHPVIGDHVLFDGITPRSGSCTGPELPD